MSNAPYARLPAPRGRVKQGVAHGLGLWDRIPVGIAMRIREAGIAVEDVDLSRLGDPIVMDVAGELHLCTTRGVRPFREGDGHWGD